MLMNKKYPNRDNAQAQENYSSAFDVSSGLCDFAVVFRGAAAPRTAIGAISRQYAAPPTAGDPATPQSSNPPVCCPLLLFTNPLEYRITALVRRGGGFYEDWFNWIDGRFECYA